MSLRTHFPVLIQHCRHSVKDAERRSILKISVAGQTFTYETITTGCCHFQNILFLPQTQEIRLQLMFVLIAGTGCLCLEQMFGVVMKVM